MVEGRAEGLPFADGTFEAVVFTFLLRYVADPEATVAELARVLRPGGLMVSLEFHPPGGPVLYPMWLLYTRLVMPMAARVFGCGWADVGSFLGPSISAFYKRYPIPDQLAMWEKAGLRDVRVQTLSLGGAVVMSGQKDIRNEG